MIIRLGYLDQRTCLGENSEIHSDVATSRILIRVQNIIPGTSHGNPVQTKGNHTQVIFVVEILNIKHQNTGWGFELVNV